MDPRRIVVEVTEEELLGDIDVFSRIIAKYRSAGCMLAIDDFGKGSGSIDRIAYINPDIIKIDKSIVQRVDVQQSFFDVCRAMSAFGDVSGFDLLFEGVETPFQLERCVAAKGRYFQGFVFSPARPEIDSGFENRDLLNDLLCLKVYRDRVKLDQRNNIQVELGQTIEQLRPVIPMEEKRLADRNSLAELGKALPYYCIRCFICDSDGRQLSPVVNLGPRRQVTATDYTSSAWLFHEFFERGVDALHCGHKGFLSNLYKTVESKQDVVTYMHELRSDRLLCVDIMSSYLS